MPSEIGNVCLAGLPGAATRRSPICEVAWNQLIVALFRRRHLARFWRATCNELGVRIMLRADTAGSTPQVASAKSSSISFLDMLSQASSDAIQALNRRGTDAQGQANNESDQGDSNQAAASTSAPEAETGVASKSESGPVPSTSPAAAKSGQQSGQLTGTALLAEMSLIAGRTKSVSLPAGKLQQTSSSAGGSAATQTRQRTAQPDDSAKTAVVPVSAPATSASQQTVDLPAIVIPQAAASQQIATCTGKSTNLQGAGTDSIASDANTRKQNTAFLTQFAAAVQPVASQTAAAASGQVVASQAGITATAWPTVQQTDVAATSQPVVPQTDTAGAARTVVPQIEADTAAQAVATRTDITAAAQPVTWQTAAAAARPVASQIDTDTAAQAAASQTGIAATAQPTAWQADAAAAAQPVVAQTGAAAGVRPTAQQTDVAAAARTIVRQRDGTAAEQYSTPQTQRQTQAETQTQVPAKTQSQPQTQTQIQAQTQTQTQTRTEPARLMQAFWETAAMQSAAQTATPENAGQEADGPKAQDSGSATKADAAPTNTFLVSTMLPPVSGESTSAGDAGRRQIAGATFSTSPTTAGATGDAVAPKTSASKDADSASQGNQSGTQPTQHQETDFFQTVAAAARTAEGCATQAGTPIAHAGGGQTSESQNAQGSRDASQVRSEGAGDLSSNRSSESAAAGASTINTARVIQSMSETEMRLGMHSSEFGNIAIRTTVSQQQVQAQISVDHGELGNAISAHIPLTQAKLGSEFGLQASIEVNQSGSSLTGGQGQSPQRESRTATQSNTTAEGSPDPVETFNPAVMAITADQSRLDIRA